VIAFGKSEAERYCAAGIRRDRLTEAPLAVEASTPDTVDESAASPQVGEGRVLLCVGPLAAHKGFRDAIWSFDILRFLYDDLRLVLVGDGPERERVVEFARVTGTDRHMAFTGPIADLARLRQQALLAWCPGRAGGIQAALEAMAAGLPVVASRTPRMAEVVAHGETGLLAGASDKADFARQTRILLEDDEARRRFGAASRKRVAAHFAPGPFVEACVHAYTK
jgi:glycosyltransferase involved in cell wall biosynthesis